VNSIELAGGQDDYPGWYMEMQELGFNYRLTDFQSSLGMSQLKRADSGLEKRRQIASKYYDAFKDCDFIKGQSGIIEGHAYHLYIIEVEDRLGLYNHLRSKSIYAQIHYIPCHLMPYYQELGYRLGDYPYAENYYKYCMSLPMYPTLSEVEQDFVIETIHQFCKG
jgi:dTDP-4-amino-4,6-dideoxygalactose transaminase